MSTARLLRTTAFRLGAVYVGLFGVAVVVLFAFLYWRTLSLIDSETDAAIASEITALNEQYQQRGLLGLVKIVSERAAAHAEGGNVYLLTRPDLQPLAGNLARWPAEARQTPAGIVFDIADDEGGGGNVRARARTFVLEGNYRLLVGRDLRQRASLRTLLAETLAWGLAATIIFGLIGASVVGRNLLSRVDAINRTGQHIVRGELKQRVVLTGAGDEFDRLAENLNSMLDQIERLMTAMREVTDNIAHDLRGPLTRMKARLELVLLKDQDPAQYRAAIEAAITETDRLLSTFSALLAIAEAESGALHQTMQSIDLVKLAEDAAELYQPVFEEKGIALETKLVSCPTVSGARQLLFQALANLLENAIKYTPSGGTVVIATRPAGAGSALSVADNGPGIPPDMRDKVLQRYVRLDQARTTPGSGLGLSLVAAVAKLHGAKLELGDNNPGLIVTIEFVHGIKADIAEAAPEQPALASPV